MGAIALMALSGCSRDQRADAGSRAREAGDEIRKTAARAQKDLSDGAITTKVKGAMSMSDKLDTSGINVDTTNRVVYLRGQVANESQRQLAERIAKDTVAADIKVVSELAVRPATAPREVK